MSAAVEILAPTSPDKLRKTIGAAQKIRVVRKPTSGDRERILVAWISDLDENKRREQLVNLVDMVVIGSEKVPLILINTKTAKPRSYRTLATLTQWANLSKFYLAPDVGAVRRIVRARLAAAESRLIASAFIEDKKLIVWTCEPKRFVVAISDIPALKDMPIKKLNDFELSESGSRLRWNNADVDLNLDSILYYADPKSRKEQDKAHREEAVRYAGVIRSFREERGLKQTNIPGLTERQVRRVEQGESIPRSSTLKKLAAAHELSLDQYLKELAKRSRTK